MVSLISNLVTNQNILWAGLALICFGFFGPGLLGLSPRKYFIITQGTTAVPIETRHTSDGLNGHMEMLKDSSVVIVKNGQKQPIDNSKNLITLMPVKPEKKKKALEEISGGPVALTSNVPDVELAPILISREFITHIPASHLSLSGKAQKDSFIKTALPLILAGNEEVERRRDAIERSNQNGDRISLEKWANLYDIEINSQDNNYLTAQLLKRADTVPVPIALAQAAMESGWGTSRFALQGNALFGQWAWRDDAGLRPLSASNDRAVVRSFVTLAGSTRAYIHNLNTHFSYQEFRDARAALHSRPNTDKTKILVKFLDRYAEIGPAYVAKLETLIRTNDFGRFSLAQFN